MSFVAATTTLLEKLADIKFLQHTILVIKSRFGKNAILKAAN